MADGVLSRQVVELKACGPDDPDGARAAAILGAYFEAQHALAFRRLLWRQLATLAVGWGLLAAFFLSRSVLIGGLLVIAGAAGYAAALAWRTGRTLAGLINDHRHLVSSRVALTKR
jgi:hypothetical protein